MGVILLSCFFQIVANKEVLVATARILPHQIELINLKLLYANFIKNGYRASYWDQFFSASQASVINSSLVNHKSRFSPTLVGYYKLLNLAWFEAHAPSQGNKLS